MKRMFSLLLAAAMSFSLIACAADTKETTGETVFETSSETADAEAVTKTEDVVVQDAYKVVEAKQGQSIQINAKYGTYLVRVLDVYEVDWWYRKYNNNVKHVAVLEYEVENISFSSAFSEGVKLEASSFRVTGDNDYQGKAFSTYYDELEAADIVKPGETKKGYFAYEFDNPTRMPESYDVVFKNSSGDIAKVNVELN